MLKVSLALALVLLLAVARAASYTLGYQGMPQFPVVEAKKSVKIEARISPLGEVRKCSAIVELVVANNWCRTLAFDLIDRVLFASKESVRMSPGTPPPDEIENRGGYAIIRWRDVELPPKAKLQFRYEVLLGKQLPFKVSEKVYLNGNLTKPVLKGDFYMLQVREGDTIKLEISLKNLEQKIASIGGSIVKPSFLMVSQNIDESKLKVTAVEPEASKLKAAGATSYVWTLNLEDENTLSLVGEIVSLGDWKEIIIEPISITAFLEPPAEYASMIEYQIETYEENSKQMHLLKSSLSSMGETTYAVGESLLLAAELIENASSSVDISDVADLLERASSVIGSLVNATEAIVEMLDAIIDTLPPSNLRDALIALRASLLQVSESGEELLEDLGELEAMLEQYEESLEDLIAGMRGMGYALLGVSHGLKAMADEFGRMANSMKREALRLEDLLSLLESSELKCKYNGLELRFSGYSAVAYCSAKVRHIYGDYWALEAVRLKVVPETSMKLKGIVYGLTVYLENGTELQYAMVDVNGSWVVPNSLDLLGASLSSPEVRFNHVLEVDGYECNILRDVIGRDVVLIVKAKNPELKVDADIAFYPPFVSIAEGDSSVTVNVEYPVLMSEVAVVIPELPKAAEERATLYYLPAIAVLALFLALAIRPRRSKRARREDREIEEIIARIEEVERVA